MRCNSHIETGLVICIFCQQKLRRSCRRKLTFLCKINLTVVQMTEIDYGETERANSLGPHGLTNGAHVVEQKQSLEVIIKVLIVKKGQGGHNERSKNGLIVPFILRSRSR